MKIQVKLNAILEEMELAFEESCSLLNTKTGEIVLLTLDDLRAAENEEPFDDLPDWQQENRMIAMDVVENFEDYIELPTKYDVNEYDIMENFCFTVRDQRKQDRLLRTIKGKGAFRRFKDNIIDLGIEDQWYSYRTECFKEIAIEWCRENNIECID
ncbi:UPF0158 family protein [Neobacillus rhizosphaerae]|uniref:UPF0158 family protein n=1 Tax=Neobacillus rhizosphaerae TaxID=2880965 RepID=UPI003D2789B1